VKPHFIDAVLTKHLLSYLFTTTHCANNGNTANLIEDVEINLH